jgi:hypothetical protein
MLRSFQLMSFMVQASSVPPPPYDDNENSVNMPFEKVNEPSVYQRKSIKNNAVINGNFGRVNSSVGCATNVTAENHRDALAQISKVLEHGVENNPTFSGTATELDFSVGCINYANTSSTRMFKKGTLNSNEGICSRFCNLLLGK